MRGWFGEASPSGGACEPDDALSGPAGDGDHLRHFLESYPGAKSVAESVDCPALSSARRRGRYESQRARWLNAGGCSSEATACWNKEVLELGVTYIIRVLCREVFYRWDGTLGNELPIGGRCLLLHNLSLHPREGGKDAGRKEG